MILISISFFSLTSCSGNKTKDIQQAQPSAKMPEVIFSPEIPSQNNLLTLTPPEELKNTLEFGKNDPFNIKDGGGLRSDISLKGIISDQVNKYAIISFKGNLVEVKEGDIGGETNKNIPNGLKVLRINPFEESIIINYKDKNIKVSMIEN